MSPTDSHTRLEELISAAEKLAIEIRLQDLSYEEININSGHCKFKNRDLILLDKRLAPEDHIEIILKELQKFDTESIFLPPWVRERLDAPSTPRAES